ncbi:MAG: FkbM family methyltransferase [Bacillota bacterium]
MTQQIIDLTTKNSMFKMILDRPGLIEDYIVEYGGWEIGLVRMLASLLKDEGAFLDIGANIGYYTLFMASSFPNMKCIGFEPHPKIYEQFKRNVTINQFKNVTTYDYAVGDFNGQTDFHITRDDHYNKALAAINYYDLLENDFQKVSVKIVTVDDILDDETKKNVRAMKIDTQGYEYEVIRGAQDLIKKSKPIICFESHSCSRYSESEIFSLLPDYKIYKINAWFGELKAYDAPDAKGYSDDLLCIHPDFFTSSDSLKR